MFMKKVTCVYSSPILCAVPTKTPFCCCELSDSSCESFIVTGNSVASPSVVVVQVKHDLTDNERDFHVRFVISKSPLIEKSFQLCVVHARKCCEQKEKNVITYLVVIVVVVCVCVCVCT